jgi:hypothetical protein
MDTRTVRALALRPTDNAQGGYYFYWTEVPMPSSVKDHVHALA